MFRKISSEKYKEQNSHIRDHRIHSGSKLFVTCFVELPVIFVVLHFTTKVKSDWCNCVKNIITQTILHLNSLSSFGQRVWSSRLCFGFELCI